MIPRTDLLWQTAAWRQILAQAFTRPDELIDYLQLDPALVAPACEAAQRFGLKVPRGFAARMEKGNPADPLLRQVLPLGLELDDTPGFSTDPVGDLGANAEAGLLHKYQGRALMLITGGCAVHCRYCFRRHFPYREAIVGPDPWGQALAYLRRHADIEEVILSGGDPLAVADHKLADLVQQLGAIVHLRRLRIHTRLPVLIPERINEELLDWLRHSRLSTVIVIHCNHPNELSEDVRNALTLLKNTGATLLNQSVLLKGVNDSPEVLIRLSVSLFESGVLPYYLHQLDRVQGAAHFEVPLANALELQRALVERLPGYLMPRLVREQAGAPSKLPVLSSSIQV